MHAVSARRRSPDENTPHVTHVRIGLLSTASINEAILGARAADAPFSVDAVGSRDPARARAYAAERGIARAHGSYDDLLADDGLDAVYVALPNALHHEWTMRALAAGKHVLCEKPYTRHPPQVEEAWAEAERRGLVLTEAYMWRHSAQTSLLRDLLPRVGEVQAVDVVFTARLEHGDDPRWSAELGGGALLDLGCYCVSAARLVLGEPDDVHGQARLCGGVDDHFVGSLRFGGAFATFQCGFAGGARQPDRGDRVDRCARGAARVLGSDWCRAPRRRGASSRTGEHVPGRARRLLRCDPRRTERADRPGGDAGPGRLAPSSEAQFSSRLTLGVATASAAVPELPLAENA